PAASPTSSAATVTWSALTLVGASSRTRRMPSGRKKWRSVHSSTTSPLWESAIGCVTQHLLHGGQGLERLLLGQHQRRIDSNLRVVDHRDHAAGQAGIEDRPGG